VDFPNQFRSTLPLEWNNIIEKLTEEHAAALNLVHFFFKLKYPSRTKQIQTLDTPGGGLYDDFVVHIFQFYNQEDKPFSN
jgi:hypothetical protein